MEYSTREITIISIISIITVVIGYIFYIIGSFLPLPGHKLIILAPFLGFRIKSKESSLPARFIS